MHKEIKQSVCAEKILNCVIQLITRDLDELYEEDCNDEFSDGVKHGLVLLLEYIRYIGYGKDDLLSYEIEERYPLTNNTCQQ